MADGTTSSRPFPGRNSHGWTAPFVVWLVISGLFIFSHFSFHFLRPHYEGGDFAANALQIRQAKDFREVHGNYSRFGFYHPGPAFFYAYALGEVLLVDTLKVVPAPFNAHAVTGIFIQALFFTWAIFIVKRRVQRPLLLPLMILFAAAHFGLVNYNIPSSAFESIWPPYVLLLPFLCFIVASASLASGEYRDLIPCVLAGSLLVHGHVAQPLFILPISLIAFAGFWVNRRHAPKGKSNAFFWTTVCAACIVAIFCVPLVLDFCKGEQSNLHLILQHLRQHSADHKSLAQSMAYLASFFYYVSNPEQYCDDFALSKLTFLVGRAPFLLVWVVTALVISIAPKPALRPERRFFFWLLSLFGTGVGVTIVWGKLQTAEMVAFNAYFNFALLYIPFILLAISLLSAGEFRSGKSLPSFLYALALVLGLGAAKSWRLNPDLVGAPSGTKEMVENIKEIAVQDEQRLGTKFLSFQHDAWPWAAGVALTLDRFGYGYAVPTNWSFIFGAHHTADLPLSLQRGELALWTIKSPAVVGDKWITTSVPRLNPAHAEISFSGPEVNASAFVVGGWDISPGPFSWSTEKTALLYFLGGPASADVQITFHLFPYTYSTRKSQRMTVSFNQEPAQSFEVVERSALSIRVPMEVWNRRPIATIAFEFPDAISPLAAGESADARVLGCGFLQIDFRSPPALDAALSTDRIEALSRQKSGNAKAGRSPGDLRRWR